MNMKTRDIANKRDLLNEVVDINGSKVFVENGEVKTVLNEEIQKTGWMTVEEAKSITLARIEKEYMLRQSQRTSATRSKITTTKV